jgi:putative peptide modification system cyclase
MNALLQPSAPTPHPAAIPLLRTLVLCDLVDSTALTQRLGDQRAADLFRKHDRLARALLPLHGGREIDKTDGFLFMFERPVQAVAFALDYQRALRDLNEAEGSALAARVGIHVGDVFAWDNSPEDIARGAKPIEVEGLVKPITSRLMQLALPNQILLSGVAQALAHRAQGELGDRLETVRWRTYGRYRFKGVPDPIPVFEVGDEGFAPLKPPPWSGKAHREVPFWRRPATLGIEVAALLLMLAIPAWYLLRPAPAIAFAERDWVVVGDLNNLTGDVRFNDSIDTAFRIGLEQSRYVNVLSNLKARETVALMQRDPAKTAIDRSVGAEIALRDGARALILPTIAEIGGRVRVTAEVVDPNTQTTVWSESADGIGVESVLPSLDQVNQKLRVRLGEALATVSSESKPLDRVATGNLDALRAYNLGQRAFDVGNLKDALTFFNQAIALDPQFAFAHLMSAQTHGDLGDNEAATAAVEAAWALKDHLPARDAIYVEAMHKEFTAPSLAIGEFRKLSSLYPDYFSAHGHLAYLLWQYANDYDGAIAAAEKSASAQNPYRSVSEYLLGTLELGQERFAEAARHFEASGELKTNLRWLPVMVDVARGTTSPRAALEREKAKARGDDWSAMAALAADGGDLAAARAIIADARGKSKLADAFKLDVVERSLHSAFGAGEAVQRVDQASAASTPGDSAPDRAEAAFRAAFDAYVAAREKGAPRTKTALDAKPGDAPTVATMKTLARAQIALAQGNAQSALDILAGIAIDGTELYVVHVARMDAYAALGDHAKARDEALWLIAHRGRAYTEYNADWVARPFNVAQSNLAWLVAAEQSIALGDKAKAREYSAGFSKRWPTAGPAFAARMRKLEATP